MPISKNEIRARAISFTKEWENETNEDAEAKSFWDEFFMVFDVRRRRLASFEYHVKKLNNKDGFIDLFWPGKLIVEHKSKGKSLDKAYGQVMDYFPGIVDKELPKYILVSDFSNFRLYDLEHNSKIDFPIQKLVDYIDPLSFIAGYEKKVYKEQDPVNADAAVLMGKLHDKLRDNGYSGHDLEVLLVRLLFCLFADDTNIFESGIFNDYIELKTKEDGSDFGMHMDAIFDVLNKPEDKRQKHLDEDLKAFPYVNGKLFEERLQSAYFDSGMRQIILECCKLDWGEISPAIFGSMFQTVMEEDGKNKRREIGAHYTSEKNILKLIKPLFLDDLEKEFESVKNDKNKLKKLHNKISQLRFLDPACGCGNFLIIAYRELRLLELKIVKALLKGQQITSVNDYFLVDVDQFYGIEYEEFPGQVAQVAMWLIDHQMNEVASNSFGEYFKRIPLKKSATIVHGNALRVDWQSLLPNGLRYDFILGNPPFVGSKFLNENQRNEIQELFTGVRNAGVLDYVSGWYLKAAKYIQTSQNTKVAFVSTSSISQGEQVGILWGELFNKYKIKIHFAHRTFKWKNEAKGVAGVHVVIIGFSIFDINEKKIFEYNDINGDPDEVRVPNINPYLVEGKDNFLQSRSMPICNVPQIGIGNKPIDDGNYLFSEEEKNDFIKKEPKSEKLFRKWLGSDEFINGYNRWFLLLKDVSPTELKQMPEVLKRIEAVKAFRLKSKSPSTRKLADTPTRFHVENIPTSNYLIIPEVSSERRKFIPIGFEEPQTLASNLVKIVPNATMYHFGVLTSLMHMTWTKYTCGRLESRYRYSKDIVYNNFPWPETLTEKQIKAVEDAAQGVLDAREQFPNSSLADLYDPNTMPPVLVMAHQVLDKAVDVCYRSQPFQSETKRIEFLFELYDKYTAGLFVKEKTKKINRQK